MIGRLEARVLVCDPEKRIGNEVFSELAERFVECGSPRREDSIYAMNMILAARFGNFMTMVDSMEGVLNAVNQHPVPYFSLIIYETGALKRTEGGPGVIANIRNIDFFLPQMIVGRGLSTDLYGHCARAGALYLVENSKGLHDQISRIFRKPAIIENLVVVKIGGSSYDFDRQNKASHNLQIICDALIEEHKRKECKRIIATVGAGQYGDVAKDFRNKYEHNPRVRDHFPKAMADALESNLHNIRPLFRDAASITPTGAFYYVDDRSVKKDIQLMGTAPHYILAGDNIPLQDSDTHTVALAEFYGAERVVLFKRTDGIYNHDPYRGFDFGKNNEETWRHWKSAQKKNQRHATISIDRLLDGSISRIGTDNRSGHLMEDSALRYMKEYCLHLKEVVAVHIAPEEMFRQVDGYNRYEHIITGHQVDVHPQGGWGWILKENVKRAIRGEQTDSTGVPYSRIVRGTPKAA